MRMEASPHVDVLEFEKGREATFNAASNFFSKIAGGSVAVVRSRDNHLLCERMGVLHSLSFYFASVAFYVSNLIVDISIYLYVYLYLLFSLAGLGPHRLATLGSSFRTEWVLSMGLVAMLPQACEMVLEFGAMHAIYDVLTNFFAATFFFIFQNKNIASAMREGAVTGIAKYFFTGRPLANQHQTWKDIYITYWKSHYVPACQLALLYTVYQVLAVQNYGENKIPMVLVLMSTVSWVATPILFTPLPRWQLIGQDIREFNSFITGGAGTEDVELPDVVKRGRTGTVRTLYECGLADEISFWDNQLLFVLMLLLVAKALFGFLMVVALPSEILDFFLIFPVVLSLAWVTILGYFAAGLNNVFLGLTFLVWVAVLPVAHLVVGSRFEGQPLSVRLPEYVIAAVVFLYLLDLVKHTVLVLCRALCSLRVPCCCGSDEAAAKRLHQCVRLCFVYFYVHQVHVVMAYAIMITNTVTALSLSLVDRAFCNAHTWWLLNNELSRTPAGERYMENGQTFFELDVSRRIHMGQAAVSSSDSGSDRDSDCEQAVDQAPTFGHRARVPQP